MKIAYYGGSFDPVHIGHMAVADALLDRFELDRFVFLPAFHAPHKQDRRPTSAYDRYAMLCLATRRMPNATVSRLEIEMPDKPYSVETLARLSELHAGDDLYFVMGADSWEDITTWRRWEEVLSLTNHIVMTRPGSDLALHHVTGDVRSRVVDLRGGENSPVDRNIGTIYFTDAVNMDVSATDIRRKVRHADASWRRLVPSEVATYIEKYQIYT
jgi:nicotinate-nucleotide adenylyltransferase